MGHVPDNKLIGLDWISGDNDDFRFDANGEKLSNFVDKFQTQALALSVVLT